MKVCSLPSEGRILVKLDRRPSMRARVISTKFLARRILPDLVIIDADKSTIFFIFIIVIKEYNLCVG